MPCKYGITTTIFVKYFIAVGKKHDSPYAVGTVHVSTVYINKYWQQKPEKYLSTQYNIMCSENIYQTHRTISRG